VRGTASAKVHLYSTMGFTTCGFEVNPFCGGETQSIKRIGDRLVHVNRQTRRTCGRRYENIGIIGIIGPHFDRAIWGQQVNTSSEISFWWLFLSRFCNTPALHLREIFRGPR